MGALGSLRGGSRGSGLAWPEEGAVEPSTKPLKLRPAPGPRPTPQSHLEGFTLDDAPGLLPILGASPANSTTLLNAYDVRSLQAPG